MIRSASKQPAAIKRRRWPMHEKAELILKEIAAFLIRLSGLSFAVNTILMRKKIGILVYHDPKPEDLDRHLNYLSKRYRFITLQHLVNAIRSQDVTTLPRRSLVITFDDGYKGNYHLLGVFEKYRIVPTIYLCSRIAATGRHFWFKEKGLDPESLKGCPNRERLRILENRFGFRPSQEYPEDERQSLSREEIIAMKNFVDFQAHTCFHPILPACDAGESEQEILGSKQDVELIKGAECSHFAYPNGDYSARDIALLKKAGYLSARTIDHGWNDAGTNPYILRAIGVTDSASINLLSVQLSGITVFLRRLMQGPSRRKRREYRSPGLVAECGTRSRSCSD
jgi:peptidoglycan/xylan/chitin deacetylase (PgdA/CDA1 family)